MNPKLTMQIDSGSSKNIPDLQQWRAKLLFWVMKGIVVAALAVGIPNVALSVARGQLFLALTHALALVWVLGLYRYRASHPQRVTQVLLVGLYMFGVITLVSESYLALIYLIILPTAAAMLVSRRATVAWLAIIAVTVFVCGFFGEINPGADGLRGQPFLSWVVVALNFLLVSAALAVSCVFLLSGLDEALKQQRDDADKLEHLAMHDTLTGLANRRMLTHRLEHLINHSEQTSLRFALLLMDLDHFKNVNDSHGHHVGDELIKAVAHRLQSMVRTSDMAVRLGGDEYVLLLTDVGSDAQLISSVVRVLSGVSGEYSCAQKKLVVSASIGVAVYPRDGQTVDDLLKNADAAMYRSKELGRNGYQFFQPEMNTALIERMKTEEDLLDALSREELVLFFQPRINSMSGQCFGAEVLVRWQHPTRGLLAPQQFIAVAEETGLIVPLGAWVLRKAADQLRVWRERYPHLRLSINISAREFRDEALGARIRQAKDGLPKNCLELEITESLIIDNLVGVHEMLQGVRQLGVTVALDDFGTGLSSLAYLKALPLDVIKIDRSFVNGVDTDRQNHAIVKTIVDLAYNLQLSTVAEGVETEAQAHVLRSLGVNELQGYHFARPMPADAFEAWLVQHGGHGSGL